MFMVITEYELKNLKSSLENLLTTVKDCLKPIESSSPLFSSRNDYLRLKESENLLPERLYFFNFDNIHVNLSFNSRTKVYQIVFKNFYSPFLDNFKHIRDTDSYILDSRFDYAKMIYTDVVSDICNKVTLKDGLF